MYLIIITVPNEREVRMHRTKTRAEAYDYAMELKNYIKIRYDLHIKGEIYALPEPVEVIT